MTIRFPLAFAAFALCIFLGINRAKSAEPKPLYDFAPGKLPEHTWVKLTPMQGTPPSPQLGYEGACVWDGVRGLLVRYGGHNQGGGGEQGSEMWTCDPTTAQWKLFEPNISPPGVCCNQQNLFEPGMGRYIRFSGFSGNHGWQWSRELYMNEASIWTFDFPGNKWRNLRPLPTAHPSGLRCASWNSEYQVAVIFGGEGNNEGTRVYDPWTNTWTRMNPKPEPESRSGGNMAYDSKNKVHVLFGTQFGNDPHTWLYDLRSNTWRDAKPPTMPPPAKNDAVLTYNAAAGVVVALVRIAESEKDSDKNDPKKVRVETWTYDVAANRWTKLDPKETFDIAGSRARQLMYAPALDTVLLENRPSNSSGIAQQQVYALRLPAASAPAANTYPMKNFKLKTTEKAVLLTWDPAAKDVPRYKIYRAGSAGKYTVPWKLEFEFLANVEDGSGKYEDTAIEQGKQYHYYVVAIGPDGTFGPPSTKLRTQPRFPEDLSVSVTGPEKVELSWQPVEGAVGYVVERAVVEVLSEDQLKRLKAQTPPLEQPSVGALRRWGAFTTLTDRPITGTKWADTSIDLRKRAVIDGDPIEERNFNKEQFDEGGAPYRHGVYAYRVRAVNAQGILGGPSAAVISIPNSPQSVFSKEEGTTCHIKWEPSKEPGVKGYRVYRMDGRFSKEKITRLTPEPITGTTFSDPEAGKVTRRYYVIAVDALGQEGFPSAPVWFEREYKRFYTPFVGEWHQ